MEEDTFIYFLPRPIPEGHMTSFLQLYCPLAQDCGKQASPAQGRGLCNWRRGIMHSPPLPPSCSLASPRSSAGQPRFILLPHRRKGEEGWKRGDITAPFPPKNPAYDPDSTVCHLRIFPSYFVISASEALVTLLPESPGHIRVAPFVYKGGSEYEPEAYFSNRSTCSSQEKPLALCCRKSAQTQLAGCSQKGKISRHMLVKGSLWLLL